MVRDHGNPRIAVVLFQDGYRFIYFLYCMLCQDGDCDVTVRTLYRETNNFLFLVPSPKIILGRRRRLLLILLRKV